MRSFSALHSQPYTVRGMTLWCTNLQQPVVNHGSHDCVGYKTLEHGNSAITFTIHNRVWYCEWEKEHNGRFTKKKRLVPCGIEPQTFRETRKHV